MTIIGVNIKNIRLNRGMTQQDLAKLLGVSDKAISAYENGTRVPKMGVVIKMANTLNITTSDILESKASDYEVQMLSVFRQLTDADKQEVLNLIDFKLSKYR